MGILYPKDVCRHWELFLEIQICQTKNTDLRTQPDYRAIARTQSTWEQIQITNRARTRTRQRTEPEPDREQNQNQTENITRKQSQTNNRFKPIKKPYKERNQRSIEA
jgi:hypothetical protein